MAIQTYSKVFALSGEYVNARIYVEEESIDVTNNTSTITLYIQAQRTNSGYSTSGYGTLSGKVDGSSYSGTISSSLNVSSTTWVTFFKKQYVIAHDSDGNKSLTITTSISWRRTGSASFTFDLTYIPRSSKPSCVTYPDTTQNVGDIGTTFTIYMNRNVDTFTHTVKYAYGNLSGTIATNVETQVDWTLPNEFMNQIPNATSGYGTITVETYNGDTKLGEQSVTFTCTVPSSVRPTLSSLAYALDNSANSKVAEWGIAVANYTKVNLTFAASGSNGSTISSFVISGAYSATVSGTSTSYNGSTITSSGSKKFTVYAVDSRGRTSASKSVSITFLAYSNPTISNLVAARSSEKATNVDLSFTVSCSSMSGNNTATYKLQYKKHNETSWSNYGNLSSNSLTITDKEFEDTSSYDLKVVVTDSMGNTASASAFLSTIGVLMNWKVGGKGIRFGGVSEVEGFVVSLDATFEEETTFVKAVTFSDVVELSGSVKLTGGSTFKPFHTAGDIIDYSSKSFSTGGYVTNSGANVCFVIPTSKPIIDVSTLTFSGGLKLRQNNTYTHGSTADTVVSPTWSYSLVDCGIKVTASLSDVTNVTSDSAIGVEFIGKITLG